MKFVKALVDQKRRYQIRGFLAKSPPQADLAYQCEHILPLKQEIALYLPRVGRESQAKKQLPMDAIVRQRSMKIKRRVSLASRTSQMSFWHWVSRPLAAKGEL